MNQKAPYEIIIADKLGQLHVPDMRDAIWSRIETQLDTDMPDDHDNGPQSPKAPDVGKWKAAAWKLGPIAVIVAVISIFFIQQKNKRKIPPTDSPAEQRTTTPSRQNNGSPPVTTSPSPGKQRPNTIPGGRNDSAFVPPFVQLKDTSTQAVSPLKTQDIPSQPPVQIPAPAQQQKQDSVVKKSRGVKGISDKDYHITLKKDSIPE